MHAMSLLRTEQTVEILERLSACKEDVVLMIEIKIRFFVSTKEATNGKATIQVYCRKLMN